MSIRLAGLTRCGLPAVTASLLAVSSAVAEPMYTVTNIGVSSDNVLPSGDVTNQKRPNLDPSGKVTSGTWDRPQPGEFKGPLPQSLKQGASGVDAVATSRPVNNAAGWGFDKDRARFADVGGQAAAPATGTLPVGQATATGNLFGGQSTATTGNLPVGQSTATTGTLPVSQATATTGNLPSGQATATGTLPVGQATATGNLFGGQSTATTGTQPVGQTTATGYVPIGQATATGTLPSGQATATTGILPVGQAPATGTLPVGQAPATGTVPVGQSTAIGTVPVGQSTATGTVPVGQSTATTGNLPVGQTIATGNLPVGLAPAPGTLPVGQATATPGTLPVGQAAAPATGTLPVGQATGTVPVGTGSQVLGVNDKSQVVGMSGPGGQNAQAFLYTQAEGITGLGKADVGSAAYAINNSGQLAGDLAKGSSPTGSAFSSFNNATPVDPNRLIDPTSSSTLTKATDINALGQIGAFGLTSLDVMHALRLAPQVPVDANSLVAAASGANDTSTTMPVSVPPLHVDLGFPQPVPEPSVLALFGLVIAGLAARRGIGRRRSL